MPEDNDPQNDAESVEDDSSIPESASSEDIALKRLAELKGAIAPAIDSFTRSISTVDASAIAGAIPAPPILNDLHKLAVEQFARPTLLLSASMKQQLSGMAMQGLKLPSGILPSITELGRELTISNDVNTRVAAQAGLALFQIDRSINKQFSKLAIQGLAQLTQSFSPLADALTQLTRLPKLHPILEDVFDVGMHGDKEAAQRLAERVQWHPGDLIAQAINLRARGEDKPYDSMLLEALTEGMMRVAACIDDRIPLALRNESRNLSTPDGELMTTSPLDWDVWKVWEWLSQESVRAAEMWLFGIPYTPAVMLSSPPDERGNLEFASIAIVDQFALPAAPLRGRPKLTGRFANREEFLAAARVAVEDVRSRGNKVTQEKVADAMAFKGIIGSANPDRQLRRFIGQFGFADWRDLLKSL